MLTKRQIKEIQALKRMRDDEIDVADIRPLGNWSEAEIGKFYRPIKKSLTVRLDADVLAWLRGQGKGYQTRINALLREAMNRSASQSTRGTDLPSGATRRSNRSCRIITDHSRLKPA